MSDYFGNLALQRKYAPPARPIGRLDPVPRRSDFRTRRIPVTATAAPVVSNQAKARAIQRGLTRQRLKFLLGVITIIFAVTGIFALVVYRQAMILELNFANLSIERQITRIEQENSQISESLAQKTNLDLIRQQAVNKLGLQDPARAQIIVVSLPDTDRVVYAMDTVGDVNNELYLADVFTNIEGYFRTIGKQGKVD
jgi:hypothetical protein